MSVPVAYKKLLEITRYITAITAPSELFQKLIDTAVEATGAERGFLLLLQSGLKPEEPLAGLHVVAAILMIQNIKVTAGTLLKASAVVWFIS